MQDNLNEMAYEYKTLVHKIKNMIDEVKSLKIDTSRYEAILKEIIRKAESSSKESSERMAMVQAFMIMDYSKALPELRELANELVRKYEVYFEASNTCELVNNRINESLDIKEIYKYVGMINILLSKIKSEGIHLFENEEKIVHQIYETAYNLVKLEIMMTGKSSIYEYAKNNGIDLYFFEMYVKKDLEELDLEDDKYVDIKNRIYEIKSGGLVINYFDLKLMKLFLSHTDTDYNKRVVERIKYLASEIEAKGNEIVERFRYFDSSEETKLDRAREKCVDARAKIIKNIISIILTSSIITGLIFLNCRFAKKNSLRSIFVKNTTTYSELTDSIDTSSEEILLSEDEVEEISDYTKVRVYGSWYLEDETFKREVSTYDFSELTLDSIYDYLKVERMLDDLSEKEVIEEDYFRDRDKYQEEYALVEQAKYTDTGVDKYVNREKKTLIYVGRSIFIYFLAEILMKMIFGTSISYVSEIERIKKALEEIKENKELVLEYEEEYKKKLKELLDIVYANDEMKEEFKRLFNQYKYLIDKPDELLLMVNKFLVEVKSQKVKTLAMVHGFGKK